MIFLCLCNIVFFCRFCYYRCCCCASTFKRSATKDSYTFPLVAASSTGKDIRRLFFSHWFNFFSFALERVMKLKLIAIVKQCACAVLYARCALLCSVCGWNGALFLMMKTIQLIWKSTSFMRCMCVCSMRLLWDQSVLRHVYFPWYIASELLTTIHTFFRGCFILHFKIFMHRKSIHTTIRNCHNTSRNSALELIWCANKTSVSAWVVGCLKAE